MTVIRPNSISGITSITAQANEINIFRSNGTIAGLNLNGVNFNTTTGVSTFNNLEVGGVLTYQDVTNVDSLGIGTFRTGINVSGGQLDVGSNIKLGNAGVITATSFVGSGAQLTGIDATTIKDSGGNTRVSGTLVGAVVSGILTATASMNVKQSGNAYLNLLSTGTGNAGIYMDASNGDIAGSDYCFIGQHNNLDFVIQANSNAGKFDFQRGNTSHLVIATNGKVGVGTTNPRAKLTIDEDNASDHFNLRNTNNLSKWSALGIAGDYSLRFYTNGGDLNFKIEADGHVGVLTTGALKIPVGNDSQRPSSSVAGDIRYNTTSGTLEFYTGSSWVGTNAAPSLNSITGDIYNGMSGRTLVINCNDISASGNDVRYSNNSTGAVIATDTSATTSGSNITSTIPSAVYNTAVGTVIKIQVLNGAGLLSSNSLTKTIIASPSGGTITSAGGYRYHTFPQGTTNFVNTIASLSVQYLVVAGGGGGGGNQGGGGGGAGGYRTGSATLGTGNYQAVVGAGGNNGGNGNGGSGTDGGNSSFNGLTSTGGGGGVNMRTGGYHGQNGRSGGSGGGASHWMNGNFTGGSGTSGQGNSGGNALDTEGLGHNGGGGGGAGASGSHGQGAYGGNGGNGSTWLNGTTYAGGGGGGCYYNNNSGGATYSIGGGAGTGGGGRGHRNVGNQSSTNYTAPTTNTNGVDGYGGGGGGGGSNPGDGGNGVVIVRYAG